MKQKVKPILVGRIKEDKAQHKLIATKSCYLTNIARSIVGNKKKIKIINLLKI